MNLQTNFLLEFLLEQQLFFRYQGEGIKRARINMETQTKSRLAAGAATNGTTKKNGCVSPSGGDGGVSPGVGAGGVSPLIGPGGKGNGAPGSSKSNMGSSSNSKSSYNTPVIKGLCYYILFIHYI